MNISQVQIRDFDEQRHLDAVRACVIELQDFERELEPRMPSGAEIVDQYVPKMIERCKTCHGNILVAESAKEIVGYATILTRVTSDELHDGDVEYGLISDLVIAAKFRGQGIGRKLLEAAESYAKIHDVRWLRIGVLAANQAATELYASMGFSDLYRELEKDLEQET